jgi:hypothetical protein
LPEKYLWRATPIVTISVMTIALTALRDLVDVGFMAVAMAQRSRFAVSRR